MQGVFKIDDEDDELNLEAAVKPKEEQKNTAVDPEEKITFIDELDFYSIFAKAQNNPKDQEEESQVEEIDFVEPEREM